MKLDLDYIKEILLYIEENHQGEPIDLPENLKEDYSKYTYHIHMITNDIKLINCFQEQAGYRIYLSIKGLTLEGHLLLDALRNDTLLNKVLKQAKTVGIGTLKQNPASSNPATSKKLIK